MEENLKKSVEKKFLPLENKKEKEREKKKSLTSSSASFSMAVNDSASARLSTAMAKNTFSRISAVFLWSRFRFSTVRLFVYTCPPIYTFFANSWKEKDTITAYKENDEVETGEHAEARNTAVRSNPIVHNGVPIFAG